MELFEIVCFIIVIVLVVILIAILILMFVFAFFKEAKKQGYTLNDMKRAFESGQGSIMGPNDVTDTDLYYDFNSFMFVEFDLELEEDEKT